MKDELKVSEHFYSIQGEGPTAGAPAVFLRLGGCNLLCGGKGTIADKKLHDGATWRCDTIEVWSKHVNYDQTALRELLGEGRYMAAFNKGARLIITGGEPLMQQDQFSSIARAVSRHVPIEVETNGTLRPSVTTFALINQFNVSPKLSNSGMPKDRRVNRWALETIVEKAEEYCLKFVVSSEKDLEEVYNEFALPLCVPNSKIWLMPGASTKAQLEELLPLAAEWAKDTGFNLGSRLQLSIWDQATGV